MRGPEKSKYLADVLQSVTNLEKRFYQAQKYLLDGRTKTIKYGFQDDESVSNKLKTSESTIDFGRNEQNFKIHTAEPEKIKIFCSNLRKANDSVDNGRDSRRLHIYQPELEKRDDDNNRKDMKSLVDQTESDIEAKLKKCLESYRSRKQKSLNTLNKVQEVEEKGETCRNSFGDGLQQEEKSKKRVRNTAGDSLKYRESGNNATAVVDDFQQPHSGDKVNKNILHYYQSVMNRTENGEKEIEIDSTASDTGKRLSKILDQIAAKGLEKLLKYSSNNLPDKSNTDNIQCDEKNSNTFEKNTKNNEKISNKIEISRENSAKTTAVEESRSLLKSEQKCRKMKEKKYQISLPTIIEKVENTGRDIGEKKKEKCRDEKPQPTEFVGKHEPPLKCAHKQDEKSLEPKNSIQFKAKKTGNKITVKKKPSKSPYLTSFGMKKKKKTAGEPIRKKVTEKECRKKKIRKIYKEEQSGSDTDSGIVCVSLKEQEKNDNQMFEMIKELIFRKNKNEEEMSVTNKKKKIRKTRKEKKIEKGDGKKGKKKPRRKKIDKPVWLVPDAHPDGFQPPKPRRRMGSNKFEFENSTDKLLKNNMADDLCKSRREFVIFLGDKNNNIFGKRSAFKIHKKNY